MKEKALRKFGLSDREIRVYTALLELGEALASKIAKKTDIPRTLVYDILENFVNKGIVSYVIKSNKKYFAALDPNHLIQVLRNHEEEKEGLIQQALPELLLLKSKGSIAILVGFINPHGRYPPGLNFTTFPSYD